LPQSLKSLPAFLGEDHVVVSERLAVEVGDAEEHLRLQIDRTG
jgi:hypothetical protein